MTAEDLARQAVETLSLNYEGNDGRAPYSGYGDHSLDFTGEPGRPGSFIRELVALRQFSYRIKNDISTNGAVGATKTVALHPGYFNREKVTSTYVAGPPISVTSTITRNDVTAINNAGNNVDAVLTDGPNSANPVLAYTDGNNKACYIFANGLTFAIEDFLAFTKFNPVRVPQITIQASDKSAFEKTLVFKQLSPFRNLGDKPVPLTDYFTTDQYQSNKIVVPTPDFQLDDQTLMSLDIDPGIELIITYKVGAINNQAYALNQKAMIAMNNVSSGKLTAWAKNAGKNLGITPATQKANIMGNLIK